MTIAELNAERDRLAYDFCGQYGFDEALLEGFRACFDAAVKLMEERRVKPLREAMKFYASSDRYDAEDVIDGLEVLEICGDQGEKAKEALAQVPPLEDL